MLRSLASAVTLAAAFSFTVLAHADAVYTSASAFALATTGQVAPTTIDFNGIAPANGAVQEPNPFTVSGITFSVPPGNAAGTGDIALIADSSSLYAGGGYVTVHATSEPDPEDHLTITLPSVTELSFNYGSFYTTPFPFVLSLSDGSDYVLPATGSISGGSLAFFGVITSTPITSATLSRDVDVDGFALDNLSFGNTPESSSLLLLATGMLGSVGMLRRKLAHS